MGHVAHSINHSTNELINGCNQPLSPAMHRNRISTVNVSLVMALLMVVLCRVSFSDCVHAQFTVVTSLYKLYFSSNTRQMIA